MAMSTGADEDVITEINVTPLVDVCLVLVIIFMAVAPFALQVGIKVLESRAKTAIGKVTAAENVQARLSRDGRLTINGRASGWERLDQDLTSALASSRDRTVIVTADDKNRVGEVVAILDAAKVAGAAKVAIMKSGGGSGAGGR
ncbi:MAG: biopolymer transporter ExbD [Elusimicrobia bacterium]|nr:biopolymer transporter ExbD [Elusimicrobiota bacterium]